MKTYFRKHILTTVLTVFGIFTVFTFLSCEKEDKNGDVQTNDNYYVKYIISGNGTYGRFSNWTATTPEGKYSNNGYQTRSWNQTYGPVKKGFKCEVQIGDYISGAPTIEIHVSKNTEPFSLKISKTGDNASYTIDY